MEAGGPTSEPSSGGLAIDLIGTLLERRRQPRKRRVEHRAHQHAEHAALELILDEEADVAGLIAVRLEGPAVLERAERALEVLDQDFEVRPIQRHLAGEGFPPPF